MAASASQAENYMCLLVECDWLRFVFTKCSKHASPLQRALETTDHLVFVVNSQSEDVPEINHFVEFFSNCAVDAVQVSSVLKAVENGANLKYKNSSQAFSVFG